MVLYEIAYGFQLYLLLDSVLRSTVPLLIFCLLDMSLFDRRMLNSTTMIVDSSIFPCSFISSCITQFDFLLLLIHMLRIIIFCQRIDTQNPCTGTLVKIITVGI